MTDWMKTLLSPDATIRDALTTINRGRLQIALVVNGDGRLEGVVTDGDVRRAILDGHDLGDPVTIAMNTSPTTVDRAEDQEHILAVMKRRKLHQVPVLDEDGRVVDLEVLDELLEPKSLDNPVVLMVGGMGTRLQPLTGDIPKPLVKVGGKPILETILERLLDHGFRQFYFSVNYKAEMIEEYFGDGERWGAVIHYLREDKRLGTAGSLSLLPVSPQLPLVVMNGDVLTNLNFSQLLQYHERYEAAATMCVRDYDMQVPYGVIRTEKHMIVDIEEKPIQRFYVNAGIYVLNVETLQHVPMREYLDMPDLFRRLQLEGKMTAVFPLREYWRDVGRLEDLAEANDHYHDIFPTVDAGT